MRQTVVLVVACDSEADDSRRRGRGDVGGGPRTKIVRSVFPGVGQCQSIHERECWVEMGGCGVD